MHVAMYPEKSIRRSINPKIDSKKLKINSTKTQNQLAHFEKPQNQFEKTPKNSKIN